MPQENKMIYEDLKSKVNIQYGLQHTNVIQFIIY